MCHREYRNFHFSSFSQTSQFEVLKQRNLDFIPICRYAIVLLQKPPPHLKGTACVNIEFRIEAMWMRRRSGSEGVNSFRRPRAIVNHPVDNYAAAQQETFTSHRVEIENYLIPPLYHFERVHRKATPQKNGILNFGAAGTYRIITRLLNCHRLAHISDFYGYVGSFFGGTVICIASELSKANEIRLHYRIVPKTPEALLGVAHTANTQLRIVLGVREASSYI